MPEKKICTLPPIRVDEDMSRALGELAAAKDVSVSWLVRKGISLVLREELEKYRALHCIFDGDRFDSKIFNVAHCDTQIEGD